MHPGVWLFWALVFPQDRRGSAPLSEQPLPLALPTCCGTCLFPTWTCWMGASVCLQSSMLHTRAGLPPWSRGQLEQVRIPAVSSLSEQRSPGVETWIWSCQVATVRAQVSGSPLPPWHLFFCQMQWHATAELKDVHSLFNDEVQQVITSVLQTAACPAPVGLRGGKWLWSSNLV